MDGLRVKTFEKNDIIPALTFWDSIEGIVLSEGDDFVGLSRFLDRNPGLSEVIYTDSGEVCKTCARDTLVGTLLAGHDGRRGFLYHVVIHPDLQGKNLGQAMVERAIERFRAIGIEKVQLLCLLDNKPGLKFWQKVGFSQRTSLAAFSRSLKS